MRGHGGGQAGVLPVSQRRPVNPEGHTHVLGDTQVPPLLHPSSQKAITSERNGDVLVQLVILTQATKKTETSFEFLHLEDCEDITMCKVVPPTVLLKALHRLCEERLACLSLTWVYKCCFYVGAVSPAETCSAVGKPDDISSQDCKTATPYT